ncbi:hypothetical protein LUZ63_012528 [Rhynchospora breviuscula]|uniref:Uncharacterized protein n=1 Tax=Rhynchospora breviuscula TaxID=2022672 RepID=A0A9Q0CKX6_9POAL|nr:hypothetical protein LUZ63_012528 [Rhynchospora breviuscula]
MPAALTTEMDRHDPSDLSSFNHHLSDLFSDLTSDSSSSSVLSLTWTRRLLDTFLISLEEFRFILQSSSASLTRPPTDRFITDFFDRAVKSLDLCTAVRDAIERVRNWQKHVQIIIGSLTGPDPLGEGPVRRARKAIGDLAIMMLDERDLPGSGSGPGFRNRSFARGSHHKDHHHGHGHAHSHGMGPHHRRSSSGGSGSSGNGHFRSLTWSVSRGWSATKQLQAIGSGLTPPRGVGTSDMSATVYTMGSVLFVSMLSLAASLPCQCDRSGSLSGAHFTAPPRGFLWGPSVYSIYEKVIEEWKRREKKSNSGLLKEIGEIERISRQLGEIIDAAQFPLEKEREVEIKEVAHELEKVSSVIKEGLDPLERQVREVFNRLVRSRTEGLDSLNRPSD